MLLILSILGGIVAAALLGLLVGTLLFPALRGWPTPGPGSWQYYAFWPLFRGLNVLCFVTAAFERQPLLGLPTALRVLAAIVVVGATAVFIYSFRVLGRDNSYGAKEGLVTDGIYQWSRNPQNAMLIVVYGALAVAADGAVTFGLCAAMIAAYVLMVWTEEPWLKASYGEAYSRYAAQVPRFFNWARLCTKVIALSRR